MWASFEGNSCDGASSSRCSAARRRRGRCGTRAAAGYARDRIYERTVAGSSHDSVEAFRRGLKEGGFVEGENVAIEFRWARGDYSRLPALAAELVSRDVAVIVAAGGEPSALAAKAATATIPIVFGIGGDPVKAGLVETLSRPGGNVTGVTLLTNTMEPKRLGLLRDLASGASLIGTLVNPNFPPTAHQLQQLEEAARAVGQRIMVAKASDDDASETAFALPVRERRRGAAGHRRSVFRYAPRSHCGFRGASTAACDLSVSRICGRWLVSLSYGVQHHRCV